MKLHSCQPVSRQIRAPTACKPSPVAVVLCSRIFRSCALPGVSSLAGSVAARLLLQCYAGNNKQMPVEYGLPPRAAKQEEEAPLAALDNPLLHLNPKPNLLRQKAFSVSSVASRWLSRGRSCVQAVAWCKVSLTGVIHQAMTAQGPRLKLAERSKLARLQHSAFGQISLRSQLAATRISGDAAAAFSCRQRRSGCINGTAIIKLYKGAQHQQIRFILFGS